MIGNGLKIDWEQLSKLVDPQYNLPKGNIGTNVHGAEIDIRQARENAMDRLNTEQASIIDRLLERYEEIENNPAIIAECEQQMKQYIIEQYNKEPAVYNGVKLPLAYDSFRYQSDAEKQCYYAHPWHSAYRLFNFHVDKKPNPWQSPDANHLAEHVDPHTLERFDGPNIPPREMAIIHAMWLALNDGEFAISDMHTYETAKAELCKIFGALVRAHNWDKDRPVYEEYKDHDGRAARRQKTRYNNDGTMVYVTEEYDDNEADKPTCPWGVQTRLAQFVMLALKQDANERPLREAIVTGKFREELIADVKGKNTVFNVIDNMDLTTLTQTKVALDELVVFSFGNFDGLDEEQKNLLRRIQPYTTEDLADFIGTCKEYFGDYRFTQKLKGKIEYLTKRYGNYGQLVLGVAQNPWGVFYDAIAERIDKRKEELKAELPPVDQKTPVAAVGNVVAPVQNITDLRQQLLEFAVQTGNLQLIYQLNSPTVSPDYIRQAALQLGEQLSTIPQVQVISEPQSQSLTDEEVRAWVVQYAIENQLNDLIVEMLDAPQADVREYYDAIALSKETVSDAVLQNSPKSLLMGFEAQRQQAAEPLPTMVTVSPELAVKFVSEPAKLLLAILNANQDAIRIINESATQLVDTLVLNSPKFEPTVRHYKPEQVVELLTKIESRLQPGQALKV